MNKASLSLYHDAKHMTMHKPLANREKLCYNLEKFYVIK